jgi:hypothetical protein
MEQEILSISERGYRFTSNVYKGYQHLWQAKRELFIHHIVIDSIQDAAVNLGFNSILQFGFKAEDVAVVSTSVHDQLHEMFPGYQCSSHSRSSIDNGTPLPNGPGMTSVMGKLSSGSLLEEIPETTTPLPSVTIPNVAQPSPVSVVASRSQNFEPIDPNLLNLGGHCGSCSPTPPRSGSGKLKKTKTSLKLNEKEGKPPEYFPDIKPKNDYYNKFISNTEAFFIDIIFHVKLESAWALVFPPLYAAKVEFIEADFPNWGKNLINWVGIRPLEGVFMLDTLSKVTLGEENPLRSNSLSKEISNDYINPRAEDDWHKEFMEGLNLHMSVVDTIGHMIDYALLIHAQTSKTGVINTLPNIAVIVIILAALHYNTDHKHAEIDIAIEEKKKHNNEDLLAATEVEEPETSDIHKELCLAGQCTAETGFTDPTDF